MGRMDGVGTCVARCPAPTIQELVAGDPGGVPPELAEQPYVAYPDADIPFDRYTSRAWHDLEMERLWPGVWQWACREERIAEPGDYQTFDIGRHSLIVTRDECGQLRAYVNACLHRGTKLKPSGSDGWSPRLACPFHGWTWDLQGKLAELPCAWDFPHVDRDAFTLPEVRVATWGGFVFVNIDGQAPPLEDYLGVVHDHFRRWDLSRRYTALHIEKELPCNWKAAQEAFMESYHTKVTHPQLLAGVADINTQYDVFGALVSRYYSASGVGSPHLETPLSEEERIAGMFSGDRASAGEGPVLRPGETARQVMARAVRQNLGAACGADLSGYTDSEAIDTIGYGLFPNATFFAGLSVPMIYRFRPLGDDPSRSLFELLFLRPIPDDGTRPEPAPTHRLSEDESYALVPGIDPAIAAVFDQDTANMRLQQEGFSASRKAGATLGRYQELRIRHFHATLAGYCET